MYVSLQNKSEKHTSSDMGTRLNERLHVVVTVVDINKGL